MTYKELAASLIAHALEWGGDEPIEVQNTPARSHDGNWLRVMVAPGDTITFEVGGSPIPRKTGLVIFQIFTKEDIGWGQAYDIADKMGMHMAYQSIGDIDTLAYTPIEVGHGNGWYQLNLHVPYRC